MVHDDIQVDEAKRTNKKRNVDGRMSHFIHKNEYLLLFVVDGLVFLARWKSGKCTFSREIK